MTIHFASGSNLIAVDQNLAELNLLTFGNIIRLSTKTSIFIPRALYEPLVDRARDFPVYSNDFRHSGSP
jgi:hypothetical protein